MVDDHGRRGRHTDEFRFYRIRKLEKEAHREARSSMQMLALTILWCAIVIVAGVVAVFSCTAR